MKWLKYNDILDKVDLYEGLEKNTLTIRLEGNISEDCPSECTDMIFQVLSNPALTS